MLNFDKNRSYGGETATLSGREFNAWFNQPSNPNYAVSEGFQNARVSEERGWNIDLSPKLLLCDGEMVRLLVSSGVCRYVEFKLLPHTLMRNSISNEWNRVPFTKEDIFVDSSVPLLKKRKFMKAMQCIINAETLDGENLDVGLFGYFKDKGIDDETLKVLIYSVYDHSGSLKDFACISFIHI